MVIEICATVVDGVFLAWFVSRMHGVSLFKKPLALIWVGLFLCYQIFVDQVFQVFDLAALAGVFVFAIGYSFSIDRKKPIWTMDTWSFYL